MGFLSLRSAIHKWGVKSTPASEVLNRKEAFSLPEPLLSRTVDHTARAHHRPAAGTGYYLHLPQRGQRLAAVRLPARGRPLVGGEGGAGRAQRVASGVCPALSLAPGLRERERGPARQRGAQLCTRCGVSARPPCLFGSLRGGLAPAPPRPLCVSHKAGSDTPQPGPGLARLPTSLPTRGWKDQPSSDRSLHKLFPQGNLTTVRGP